MKKLIIILVSLGVIGILATNKTLDRTIKEKAIKKVYNERPSNEVLQKLKSLQK